MRPSPVAAAVLIALGTAAPAHAARAVPAPEHGIFLTVSGTDQTWIRGVLLDCGPTPPPGPHPQAAKACEALALANGDFDALADDPHACTKEYDPVKVRATGTYGGRAVDWRRTYPNACALDADTGYVFRF